MSNCLFCQLDTCLAVLLDDVSSNVWLALFSLANDSVVSTCLDMIPPNHWRADLTLVAAHNPNSIFMAFLDNIIYDT